MKRPPAIKTIRDQIADQLRNEILADQHSPDLRLREQDLATRFGTSRGPVRDVLLQLTQEGALVYKPNAGVRVSPAPDPATRTLLMSLRKQIELHALTAFMVKFEKDDAQTLRDILETMERACRRRSMPDIVGSDIALHRYLVRQGAAPEVERVWLNIVVRIRMAYSRMKDHMGIHDEHARIVKALCARKIAAGRAALEANLV